VLLQKFHLTVDERSEDSPKSPSVCYLHNQATGVSFEGDFIVKLTLVFCCYILLCEVKNDKPMGGTNIMHPEVYTHCCVYTSNWKDTHITDMNKLSEMPTVVWKS